jgi:hypothetical protein
VVAVSLVAMLCAGFILAILYMIYETVSGLLGWAIAILCGVPCLIFIGAVPFVVWINFNSVDLVTLKKNQWQCSASHKEINMHPIGKVWVTSINEICDQYGRINRGDLN